MNPAHLHPLAAALAATAFTFTLAGAAKKSVRFQEIVLTEPDLGDAIIADKNSPGWSLAWFEQMKAADGGIPFAERHILGTRDEEKRFGVACSRPPALTLADRNGDAAPDAITASKLRVFVALNRRHSAKP